MKYSKFLFLAFFAFAVGCEQGKDVSDNEEKPIFRPLVEVIDGIYTEWYPGHKQVKIRGRQNDDGSRQGVWKSYTEQGFETSVMYFSNGKKDGYAVVYHPNGALHYRGEYRLDEKVGLWSFYDENGELTEEINFDTLPQDKK